MAANQKIVCIIPARLASTRFPGKVLKSIQNKPMLSWVWHAAHATKLFDDVLFAIDSLWTADLIESFGGKYFMTSDECKNGTERLIELMQNQKVTADVWVNWQGDEPFITTTMIKDLLQSCSKNDADIWTLCKRIEDYQEIANPHVAKVVRDANNNALYFSRSTIPYYRDPRAQINKTFYKHIGIYAYTTTALKKIAELSTADIEDAEQLEQLRFLYNGLTIKVHETNTEVFGIDLPEHIEKAEKFAKEHGLV